jgi:hypothetical protein
MIANARPDFPVDKSLPGILVGDRVPQNEDYPTETFVSCHEFNSIASQKLSENWTEK